MEAQALIALMIMHLPERPSPRCLVTTHQFQPKALPGPRAPAEGASGAMGPSGQWPTDNPSQGDLLRTGFQGGTLWMEVESVTGLIPKREGQGSAGQLIGMRKHWFLCTCFFL